MTGRSGMTLVEIVAASIVIAVVLAGTMAAFVTAARIVGKENLFALAEANGLLRQTADEMRNGVYEGASTVEALAGSGWQMAELIHTPDLPNGKRCRMVADGCGGDCYEVKATVCWNNDPTCPC